ncbi:MAG: PIN domain-containing protein [Nitrospirae bacterium]|nr:PIN domain-containing protein [Nitrospirota bacterium]
MDRVFLDANILFSAAYLPDAGLRRLWELPGVELVTSAYAVEEARRNLDHPKQLADLERLLRVARVMDTAPRDRPLHPAAQLPDADRPILLAAIDAQATHLLTGDVRHFGRYYGRVVEGVRILPPGVYLRTRRKRGRAR